MTTAAICCDRRSATMAGGNDALGCPDRPSSVAPKYVRSIGMDRTNSKPREAEAEVCPVNRYGRLYAMASTGKLGEGEVCPVYQYGRSEPRGGAASSRPEQSMSG